MEEVWKEIISVDPHYIISTTGIVKNTITGNIVGTTIGNKGYVCIFLKKNGIRKRFFLHRLLLMTFVRLPKEGEQCRHLDGNPGNYSLTNLKWGTGSENRQDRTKHGREPKRTSRSPLAKLVDKEVLEIDFLVSRGVPLLKIAKRFSVSFKTIWSIRERETYKYLWNKPAIPESK